MSTGERHLIWLIEDDLALAAETIALLESLQYEVVHSGSAEEAREVMPTLSPCVVLLDLGLRATRKGLVSPSLTLLTGEKIGCEIRAQHPARNAFDKHVLQIIAMTGHEEASTVAAAVRIMQTMADDFFTKGDTRRRLDDVFKSALRHAGRELHEACVRVDSRIAATARGAQHRVSEAPRKTLRLTNQRVDRRVQVQVGGKTLAVRPGSYKLLVGLAVGRHRGGNGEMSRDELGEDAPNASGLTRLRDDLKDKAIVECHGARVRLDPRVAIEVDASTIVATDKTMEKWVAELQKPASPCVR